MKRWLQFLFLLLAAAAFAHMPERKAFFQFDGANRLTNTITPLGRSNSLAFNPQGLVSTAKDPAGQTVTYSYDAKGRLTYTGNS